MSGSRAIFLRFWRLHACRNPLARYSDRLEGALVISAVLPALIGVPVAAVVGSESCGARCAR